MLHSKTPPTKSYSGVKPPTLVVVEDDQDIRVLFRALAVNAGFIAVGEAANGREALSVLRELKPTIAVIDLHLPLVSGVEVISAIHRERPEIKLLAITGVRCSEFIDGALAAGASAYLTKPVCIIEFKATLDALVEGRRYLSAPALDRVWDAYVDRLPSGNACDLTARQRDIVSLVAEGLSNKEISTKLSISVRTVEKHRAEAMERLNLQSAAELVRYAVRKGMIDSSR